jgi:predicted metal-dependent enzyme (double-stranded beta helix superfamily)
MGHDKATAQKLRRSLRVLADLYKDSDDVGNATKVAMPLIEEIFEMGDIRKFGVPRIGHHVQGSFWLYYDGNIGINISEHPANAEVPVHDHGTFELIAPLSGRIDYTAYRQTDDQSSPGNAKLEVTEQRILNPYDIQLVDLPPGDIHGWTVLDPGMRMFVILGPALGFRRRYFDVSSGTYEERDTNAASLSES